MNIGYSVLERRQDTQHCSSLSETNASTYNRLRKISVVQFLISMVDISKYGKVVIYRHKYRYIFIMCRHEYSFWYKPIKKKIMKTRNL